MTQSNPRLALSVLRAAADLPSDGRLLEQRPWGARDFYVEDPDGHILCFSEAV